MKINRLTIKNFRSFKDAKIFNIDTSYTVITGENNCGKSNVLRALDLFFNGKIDGRVFEPLLDMHAYTVNENGKEKTTISMNFSLNSKSDKPLITKFQELIKEKILQNFDPNNVTLSLNVSRSNYEQIQYFDPINGQKFQPKEVQDLFYYEFRKSANYIYIPAIKDLNSFVTKDMTYELIKRIFNTWGRGRNPKAQDFKSKFDNIKSSIGDIISETNNNITEILQEQSSQIKNFIFNVPFRDITEFLSSLPITIDDSVVTDIARKGSGIQAMTMFSLLRYLDKYKPTNKNSSAQYIWAIEEPETFLHPKAQRNLYSVLAKYSEETPVFLTTHSYHFLNTKSTSSNFLLIKELYNHTSYAQTSIHSHDAKNQWKPFLNILGTYVPDFIPTNGYDKVYLFFEGGLDIRYFKKALSFYPSLNQLFTQNVEFVDSKGEEIKKKVIDALNIYRLKCIAIVDGDEKGQSFYTFLKQNGLQENITLFQLNKAGISFPTMEGIVAQKKEVNFISTMPPAAKDYWFKPKMPSLFDNVTDSPPAGWDKNSIKNKMCEYIEKNGEKSDFADLKTIIDSVAGTVKDFISK